MNQKDFHIYLSLNILPARNDKLQSATTVGNIASLTNFYSGLTNGDSGGSFPLIFCYNFRCARTSKCREKGLTDCQLKDTLHVKKTIQVLV